MPGFDPVSVRVRFVVEKVVLGQVLVPALALSAVSIVPPVLHNDQKDKREPFRKQCCFLSRGALERTEFHLIFKVLSTKLLLAWRCSAMYY
jgi:hypothetical protein